MLPKVVKCKREALCGDLLQKVYSMCTAATTCVKDKVVAMCMVRVSHRMYMSNSFSNFYKPTDPP